MKSKHRWYLSIVLFLFTLVVCKSAPPAYQEAPADRAAIDREDTAPGSAALDDLEAVVAIAEAARQKGTA
jgi:hypothetical protein